MVYTSGISPSLVAQQQKMPNADQQQQQQSAVGNETVESMQECKLKLLCR